MHPPHVPASEAWPKVEAVCRHFLSVASGKQARQLFFVLIF
jgi:hypothetical protein